MAKEDNACLLLTACDNNKYRVIIMEYMFFYFSLTGILVSLIICLYYNRNNKRQKLMLDFLGYMF